MLRSLQERINRLYSSTRLPAVLLLAALASLFVFQNDLTGFQSGHHGFLSSHGMAIAANLSPDHNFLMFTRMKQEEGGTVSYDVYNRFPIGAFAVIRLATLPFHNDLSMQISVARMVMLCFFALAAWCAYLSLVRIAGSRQVAVIATLFSFSSYYCLFYNDMIFCDMPTFFGLLLTFHGMVVFEQEKRFAQLLVKSCAALCFGWQIYGILLPFTLLGFLRELYATRSVRSCIRSRYCLLGVCTLCFGAAILAGNLAGEYLALDVRLAELPTFRKMLWRTGLSGSEAYEQYGKAVRWPVFLSDQLGRIGKMSVPYALVRYETNPEFFISVGGGAVIVAVLGIAAAAHRLLVASLVVSGLCWSLPMRHFTAFHDFQSIFYIGIPVVVFSVLPLPVERVSRTCTLGIAAAAFLLFFFSAIQINSV